MASRMSSTMCRQTGGLGQGPLWDPIIRISSNWPKFGRFGRPSVKLSETSPIWALCRPSSAKGGGQFGQFGQFVATRSIWARFAGISPIPAELANMWQGRGRLIVGTRAAHERHMGLAWAVATQLAQA